MRTTRAAAVAAVMISALVTSGCGEGASSTGWASGEPEWSARGSAGGAAARGDAHAAPGAVAPHPAATTAAPGAPRGGSPRQGSPRAGSVDDNADYAAYQAYLARMSALGVRTRPFASDGRVVVSVTGSDGRPVPGQQVLVRAGDREVARLRTTADGTARYWPGLYDAPAGPVTVSADGASAAAVGGRAALRVGRPGGRARPAVDVLFLLDATGSMGDEIAQLRTTIDTVAGRIAALPGGPTVRFGLTVYRDQGDSFVTASYDLTGDLAKFREALSRVRADGGGDEPEALDEALAEALAVPRWGNPENTLQLVFLVADAPPHVDRQVPSAYPASIRTAIERGAKIFPIASSDSSDQAEAVFRQMAAGTGARFVFLSYGAGGAATGQHSDITAKSYQEMALDDLVVRLVGEEVAQCTGAPPMPSGTPPAPTGPTTTTGPAPTPTTPPGQ